MPIMSFMCQVSYFLRLENFSVNLRSLAHKNVAVSRPTCWLFIFRRTTGCFLVIDTDNIHVIWSTRNIHKGIRLWLRIWRTGETIFVDNWHYSIVSLSWFRFDLLTEFLSKSVSDVFIITFDLKIWFFLMLLNVRLLFKKLSLPSIRTRNLTSSDSLFGIVFLLEIVIFIFNLIWRLLSLNSFVVNILIGFFKINIKCVTQNSFVWDDTIDSIRVIPFMILELHFIKVLTFIRTFRTFRLSVGATWSRFSMLFGLKINNLHHQIRVQLLLFEKILFQWYDFLLILIELTSNFHFE